MPTILRKNGFRFFFYSRENGEPPHIHVIGHGGEAKLWLNPIEIVGIYNLGPKDQREILKITEENVKLFLDNWSEWHGTGSTKS